QGATASAPGRPAARTGRSAAAAGRGEAPRRRASPPRRRASPPRGSRTRRPVGRGGGSRPAPRRVGTTQAAARPEAAPVRAGGRGVLVAAGAVILTPAPVRDPSTTREPLPMPANPSAKRPAATRRQFLQTSAAVAAGATLTLPAVHAQG